MYCFVNNFLNEEQVENIVSVGEQSQLELAKVESDGEFILDKEVGSVQRSFLNLENETEWINDHFYELAKSVKFLFKSQYNISLDISGGLEKNSGVPCVNYLVYNNSDHYDWHRDRSSGVENEGVNKRALSSTVQLSDPEEYEGGELVLRLGDEEVTVPKQKGLCCTFLSKDIFHKVNAVTSGTRRALVAWNLSG
tara:strand:+ start:899 stop:1483 length:585 start_codon:yes stop_codon:yes gene_type:complete